MNPRILLGLTIASALVLGDCGSSEETDLCRQVSCDSPPASVCKDQDTLTEYQTPGTCTPGTGQCSYTAKDRACDQGCQADACVGDQEAWGWIAVLEHNDQTMWLVGMQSWFTGTNAYFAQAASYRRILPQHLKYLCTNVQTEGPCTLYQGCGRIGPPILFDTCSPPCTEDQECIYEGAAEHCEDLPKHFDVGTITLAGLKTAASMTADEWDRYSLADAPDAPFEPGATVTAAGGELEPFSLSAEGPTPLSGTPQTITLTQGATATLTWTPADPGSRIVMVLLSGYHDPAPPVGLVCEGPDQDGQLVVPAALVDGFLAASPLLMKPSFVIRYNHDVQQPFGKPIELVVGSARAIQVIK